MEAGADPSGAASGSGSDSGSAASDSPCGYHPLGDGWQKVFDPACILKFAELFDPEWQSSFVPSEPLRMRLARAAMRRAVIVERQIHTLQAAGARGAEAASAAAAATLGASRSTLPLDNAQGGTRAASNQR